MAKHKLNAKKVDAATAGTHEDGDGLRLVVSKTGAKRWILRTTVKGKRKDLGLGGYPAVTLALARAKASDIKTEIAAGTDPTSRKPKKSNTPTFKECATEYIASKREEWTNPKHAQQWENTLKTYALKLIGNKAIDSITRADILAVLRPIWTNKTETASRVRNRIENIIDFAIALDYREGDNPARWKGGLAQILAKPSKVSPVRNHPAMPFSEVASFIGELITREHPSSHALQLLIYTATRTSEVLGARWEEFDLKNKIWTIPAIRMKAGTEHRVPITDQMLKLLESMESYDQDAFLFPGTGKAGHLSNMALLQLMRGMGHGKGGDKSNYVPHGFRSSFRDWAGEASPHPNFVCEMALAHKVKGVEGTYRRADLLDKRRNLMQDWSNYIDPQ